MASTSISSGSNSLANMQKIKKMGGLNMPIVLILEALAEAAIEFYVAKKAIDALISKKGGITCQF